MSTVRFGGSAGALVRQRRLQVDVDQDPAVVLEAQLDHRGVVAGSIPISPNAATTARASAVETI